MSIYSIQIVDFDERVSPPEKLLDVAVVDGIVYLDIVKYEETNEKRKGKPMAGIGVDIRDLLSAVNLLDAADKTQQAERNGTTGNEQAPVSGPGNTSSGPLPGSEIGV